MVPVNVLSSLLMKHKNIDVNYSKYPLIDIIYGNVVSPISKKH